MLGDFNLPKLKWRSSAEGLLPDFSCLGSTESDFVSFLSYLNLRQFNSVPNQNQVILDFVISNISNISVSKESCPLLKVDCHHPPLIISCPNSLTKPLAFSEVTYDFYSGNYPSIITYLATVNWDSLFKDCDINHAVDCFYKVLYDAIYKFVPITTLRKSSFPYWFSSELKDLVFKKKLAHKKFKISNSPIDFNLFSNLRSRCKKLSKYDYSHYLTSIQKSITTNPKKFWHYIKSKKSKELPSHMYLNDLSSDDGSQIVNYFAAHFSSVYVNSSVNLIPIPPNSPTTSAQSLNFPLSSCSISKTDIFESLNSLNNNLSAGPDLIPNIFLQHCKYVLVTPLHYLFNLSLSSGIFPTYWKSSIVSPIHKNSDSANVINYRPISLLSLIPKLFEDLVSKQIIPTLNLKIINEQHGFRTSRSTSTNLLVFTQFINDAFANGHQVDVIFTDLSKAFDSVSHIILKDKLRAFGICDPLLSWLFSYFSDRSQIVKYRNYYSHSFPQTSGVPQGSHLSPILFLIYINDITLSYSNMLLFADDLKIFRTVRSTDDVNLLQSDLNSLSKWCDQNNLALNAKKCKVMSFNRSHSKILSTYCIYNEPLEKVSNFKDLGVFFDTKLTFDTHINFVKNKSLKQLGFIKFSCGNFSNRNALILLYTSYIRSSLDYCSIVWSPYLLKHKSSLETVQNKFLGFLCYRCNIPRIPHTSYVPILEILCLDSLELRRIKLDLCYLYNVLHNNIDCPEFLSHLSFLVPQRITRAVNTFYIPTQPNNYMLNYPISRVMYLSNKYKIDFFSHPSLFSFKKHLNCTLRTIPS